MQTLRKIDDWFIGAGEGTVSDRLYYYGTLAITGAVFCATMYAM